MRRDDTGGEMLMSWKPPIAGAVLTLGNCFLCFNPLHAQVVHELAVRPMVGIGTRFTPDGTASPVLSAGFNAEVTMRRPAALVIGVGGWWLPLTCDDDGAGDPDEALVKCADSGTTFDAGIAIKPMTQHTVAPFGALGAGVMTVHHPCAMGYALLGVEFYPRNKAGLVFQARYNSVNSSVRADQLIGLAGVRVRLN